MNFQPITAQYIDKNEENLNSVLQRIFTATVVLVLAPSNFRCLEIVRVRNQNKNPAAERAVREL